MKAFHYFFLGFLLLATSASRSDSTPMRGKIPYILGSTDGKLLVIKTKEFKPNANRERFVGKTKEPQPHACEISLRMPNGAHASITIEGDFMEQPDGLSFGDWLREGPIASTPTMNAIVWNRVSAVPTSNPDLRYSMTLSHQQRPGEPYYATQSLALGKEPFRQLTPSPYENFVAFLAKGKVKLGDSIERFETDRIVLAKPEGLWKTRPVSTKSQRPVKLLGFNQTHLLWIDESEDANVYRLMGTSLEQDSKTRVVQNLSTADLNIGHNFQQHVLPSRDFENAILVSPDSWKIYRKDLVPGSGKRRLVYAPPRRIANNIEHVDIVRSPNEPDTVVDEVFVLYHTARGALLVRVSFDGTSQEMAEIPLKKGEQIRKPMVERIKNPVVSGNGVYLSIYMGEDGTHSLHRFEEREEEILHAVIFEDSTIGDYTAAVSEFFKHGHPSQVLALLNEPNNDRPLVIARRSISGETPLEIFPAQTNTFLQDSDDRRQGFFAVSLDHAVFWNRDRQRLAIIKLDSPSHRAHEEAIGMVPSFDSPSLDYNKIKDKLSFLSPIDTENRDSEEIFQDVEVQVVEVDDLLSSLEARKGRRILLKKKKN